MNNLSRSAGEIPGPLSRTINRTMPAALSCSVSTAITPFRPFELSRNSFSQSIDRVIDEVHDDASDLLEVEAELWQPVRQVPLHGNVPEQTVIQT